MAEAKQLPSGNWRVQIFLGRDKNGKKITKSFTADTRWKAEKAAEDFLNGVVKLDNPLTIGEAIDGYIKLKEQVLSPTTIEGYRMIRMHRLQKIMDLQVQNLTSVKLQLAINEDAATLSHKSISSAVNLVKISMRIYGVKFDYDYTLPPKKPKIKQLPSAMKVLSIIHGTDLELPCILAMWMSLRISEVRGLQFRDVHKGKEGYYLQIQRSKLFVDGKDVLRDVNKTFGSTRQVSLPPYIKDLIDKVPHNANTDFIVDKRYPQLHQKFYKLMRRNGIAICFHDLRHMSASVMLALGIPDKYAMERGGWVSSDTLKNVYQHTFDAERKAADFKIDQYFEELLKELDEEENTKNP